MLLVVVNLEASKIEEIHHEIAFAFFGIGFGAGWLLS